MASDGVAKNKGGRPSIYSEELVALICKKIASNSMSLRKICEQNPELPCVDTICEWRWEYPEFSERYLAAKKMQAELLPDECLDIADDARNDWMAALGDEEQGLGWKLNGEHVQRSKLRIETRMRINARLSQNNNKPTPQQSAIEKMLQNGD